MMKQTRWWALSPILVCKELDTDPRAGLTTQEVQRRLSKWGPNKLPEHKKETLLMLFLKQFMSSVVAILIGACAIAAFLGEWVDAFAIGAIVLLNALIGFFQEYGAEQSLAALRRMTQPLAHVMRDGSVLKVFSEEIVPGDILLLEAGDVVAADGRILETHELMVDEASLTGESVPVLKMIDSVDEASLVAERTNMAFMGTAVVGGRGTLVVTQTGKDTQMGIIAKLLEAVPEPASQLHSHVQSAGYFLFAISAVIVIAVLLLGLLEGKSFLPLLLVCLSLAVAAIPEGLPAVITVALARTVQRMARHHALIRRLNAVEQLGYVSVICTDKTGTLTLNRMVARKIWLMDAEYTVTGQGYSPDGHFEKGGDRIVLENEKDLRTALMIGVLCNNALLEKKHNQWSILGDPTEGALLAAAAKADFYKAPLEKKHPLVREIPFDSTRRMMSVVRDHQPGFRQYVKGAFDAVLVNCTHVLRNGSIEELSDDMRKAISTAHDQYAAQAFRVLAVAFRDSDDPEGLLEQELVFVALMALFDPPRPEAKDAIEQCKSAGIRVIMLTGDHKETARAIGKELGLLGPDDTVVAGKELETMDPVKIQDIVGKVSVFARITVEHKMLIVAALKKEGHIVAMTGDGVNDAPAIKLADIGLSMGITGTEVTKEASDIIIADDNFASIVRAVKEGRGVHETVIKCIKYLFSSNIAELLVVLFSIIVGIGMNAPLVALLPLHVLWINLVSDGLPAVALAFDPLHPHLMEKSPAYYQKPLLTKKDMYHLVVTGTVLALGALSAFLYGASVNGATGQTMAFTMLVLVEFLRLSLVRAEYHVPFWSNVLVLIALGSSIGLQLLILYVPFLQKIFSTVALGLTEWLVMSLIFAGTWAALIVVNKGVRR